MTIREVFRDQAKHCAALESPFMARLMALFADRLAPGDPVSDRVLEWPGDPSPYSDSVPLRLAGALHALKLDGLALVDTYPPHSASDDVLWVAVTLAMQDHAARVLDWLDFAPQTNEVRRSAMILPALAHLGARFDRPAALFELGASGGLNLRADRFRLEASGRVLGDPDSAVRLTPDWHGRAPLGQVPAVISRAGVDLNLLDSSEPTDRLRLLAYLWPDQPERMVRTVAAMTIAEEVPATLASGDAGAWLENALTASMPGVMRVIFHTVAWQYFPPETRRRAEAALARAGATAKPSEPLARLSIEADGGRGAAITLTTWPAGKTETLGRADFHGRWVSWGDPQR